MTRVRVHWVRDHMRPALVAGGAEWLIFIDFSTEILKTLYVGRIVAPPLDRCEI